MGGTSTQSQSSQQQSQLTPWAPAGDPLQGVLGNLAPSVNTIQGTPLINQAYGQLEANAQGPNPYAAPAQGATLAQLQGGPNFAAATNAALSGYQGANGALQPYLTGSALNPSSNPALASELSTVNQQVQNTVNPEFAAAGRLGSPANAQAIATGIALGDTGLLQNAATNQIGAAGTIANAGNSTGGVLGGLDVGNAGIQSQGITNAPSAFAIANQNPYALLSLATQQQQQPIQTAGLLESIYGPLAGQFGTQNSNGTSTGTSTMAGAQQFDDIAQGFGSLLSPFKTTSGLTFPKIA